LFDSKYPGLGLGVQPGDVTPLRSYDQQHDRNEVEILGLNEAQIPTTSWFQASAQEAVSV
jgi:hypothetical protein